MQVRLAFSIAIRAKSDILLFDEVLAVGDTSFQQKCYDTFETLKEAGRTIILVTHDMSAVQRFCERAILIDKGHIAYIGDPSEIADRYLEQNYEKRQENTKENTDESPKVVPFEITDITLSGTHGVSKSFNLYEEVEVHFKVIQQGQPSLIRIGLQVFKNDGTYVFGTNSKNASMNATQSKSIDVRVLLKQHLGPGTYHVTLAVMNDNATKVLKYLPKVATFNIKQQTKVQGISLIDNVWDIR
jgi:ABC-type multidrug transport system ATPase subunit